jgi:hypothetical protein
MEILYESKKIGICGIDVGVYKEAVAKNMLCGSGAGVWDGFVGGGEDGGWGGKGKGFAGGSMGKVLVGHICKLGSGGPNPYLGGGNEKGR